MLRTEGDGRLRRLPPGRHGLPREFVTRNQRERLIAGMIAAVAELGYREASVGRISAAAGVSRQTFYDYFSTKEECFLASYGLLESHVLEAVGEAGGDERGWTSTVNARIVVLLEILAANPDLVRFGLAAPPATGDELIAHERQFLRNLLEALTADAPKSVRHSPSEIESEAVAGGMAALLVARVEGTDDPDLEDLRAELVQLVLRPFLGHDRAVAVARTGSA